MSAELNIQYISHSRIDKTKWDKCVDEAANGLIYGYSFYLDIMSKNWDALVLDGYDSIMPLTWSKKFGVYYLYQPPFSANLGVFTRGKISNEAAPETFIEAIPRKFRLIEISLNHGNHIHKNLPFVYSRTNYILKLDKDYDSLNKNYRENHRRNIHKATDMGCTAIKDIPLEEVISLSKQQMRTKTRINTDDYDRFEKLYSFLSARHKAVTYGIIGPQRDLLSSCVFFFSHQRAYYILVGNHPRGRNLGCSHALIDAFIKDHAGKDLVLDFEGSDLEGLALFYAGFGASPETYPAIMWNRLPWPVRWLK